MFSINATQKEAPPPCFSLLSLNSCPSLIFFFVLLSLMCSSWNGLTLVCLCFWDAGDPVRSSDRSLLTLPSSGLKTKGDKAVAVRTQRLSTSCFQHRDIWGRPSIISDVDPFSNPCCLNSAEYFKFVILILLRHRWFPVANAENKMPIVLE